MYKILIFIALLFCSDVHAEVADKIQSYTFLWSLSLSLSVLCLLCTWFKKWFFILTVLVSVFLLLGTYSITMEEDFKKIVLNEMGENYFLCSYISEIFIVIPSAFVFFMKRKG